MHLFTSMLVHIEFRVYLFNYTSHLCLGPSDPFYHISPLLSCLCLGLQCLEVSGCLELDICTLEVLFSTIGSVVLGLPRLLTYTWFAVVSHHGLLAYNYL